mgnify:CR=1 FL=1
MASSDVTIRLIAKDEATKVVNDFNTSLKGLDKNAKTSNQSLVSLKNAALGFGAVLTGLGIKELVSEFKKSVDASSSFQSAMIGLSSVAKAFSVDAEEATQAAQDLAADGLLSVKDAADGLKNLLATGFSLPEAIKLMNAFKDSAAFNRQGTLAFGEAIVGATQGLKNQNSILVDNAGITKNLSNILEEAGFSMQDLGKITTDTSVRTALYNGILEEASIFQGDAAKAADTFSGAQEKLKTSVFNARKEIGDQFIPTLTNLFNTFSEGIASIDFTQIFSTFRKLVNEVEEKTGIITFLKKEFKSLAAVFTDELLPTIIENKQLFSDLAKVGGTVLVAALIVVVETLKKVMHATATTIDILGNIRDVMATVASAVYDKIQNVMTYFEDLKNVIVGKVEDIKNSIFGIPNAIGDAFSGAVSKAKSLVSSLPSFSIPGLNSGGVVTNHGVMHFAEGGVVPGVGNQDTVPALLTPGEIVINPKKGQGMGSIEVNFNNATVRNDSDLDAIIRAVKQTLNRDAQLQSLGV